MTPREGQEPQRGSTLEDENAFVEEWKPSLVMAAIWTILTLVLTIFALFLFAYIFSLIGDGGLTGGSFFESESDGEGFSVIVRFSGLLPLMILSVGVLLLHEAIHGIGFWYYGGRPKFGAGMVQKVLPVLYCTAPGYVFSRAQFSVIILGPLVAISLLGIVAMPFTTNGVWLVFPLALNFGGAVGDLWMFGMLLRRPQDTKIEDLKDGLRFHYPVTG